MKILVAFKRVVDPDARVKLKADKSAVDTSSAEYKPNPFCENALEEALRLAEKEGDAEVVLVSIGSDDVTPTIRSGLALGAARAVRVDVEDQDLDSDLAARILAAVFEKEAGDLFIFGKQAVDGDNNQVGQLVAEYLGLPQACFASKVELAGGEAVVTREVDGGLETIAIALPAVITADLRLNKPRFAKLPDIMKAKKKPIDELDLDDLGIADKKLKVEVVALEEPPKRKAGQKVGSVDELVQKLKSEARAI
ncbi:MAG: electron transfer flavoprotein subunit beta/FixA family protein [Deltaproteobacteria bacterium]|nr:electron transfer flavoprotein subunit beta/FixA family protein [Deltaproteobacteria bacterium]